MVEFFGEQLRDIETKVILILDSLDQLSPEDGALNMKWLPKEISSTVSIILSTLPGVEYHVLPSLKVTWPPHFNLIFFSIQFFIRVSSLYFISLFHSHFITYEVFIIDFIPSSFLFLFLSHFHFVSEFISISIL